MKDVGGLANPDPTDTASWSGEPVKPEEISIDEGLEDSKAKLKRQAQNWAGFVYSLHILRFSPAPPVLALTRFVPQLGRMLIIVFG